MKVALGLFVIVAFSACKKDYTCTCTSSLDGVTVGDPVSTVINDKKDAAKEACEALDISVGTAKTECSID